MDCYANYKEEYLRIRSTCDVVTDPALKRFNGWSKSSMDSLVIGHYTNGILHNDNGPSYMSNYGVIYFKNGKEHREGGPAVMMHHGGWIYRWNNLNHRLDGPANCIVSMGINYGTKRYDYTVNGWSVDDEVKEWSKQNKIDPLNMDDNERVLFTLFMSGLQ